MFFLQPILEFVHFIRTTIFFIWGISLHLGRGIFVFMQKLVIFVKDIYNAIVILGEELLRFFTDLNTSIDTAATCISSSANSGINGFIDGIANFWRGLRNFFTSSDLHTRLLATRIGLGLKTIGNLLLGALKLIADTVWWLVTLVPRLIIMIVIAFTDACIFSFHEACTFLLYALRMILNDIFKIIISLFAMYLIYRRRHLISALIVQCFLSMKTFLQRRLQTISSRWRSPNRVRLENLSMQPNRRSPLSRPAITERGNTFQQTCVVCRDNPKSVLLWPCRHMCLCEFCADRITEMSQTTTACPLCRSPVDVALSVYT